MKLRVAFSIDPTGHASDITTTINIEKDVNLFCYLEKESSFYKEIKKAIEKEGYDLTYYYQLFKVYSC